MLRNVARQKTVLSVSWYVDFDFSDRIGLEPLSGVAVAFVAFVLADFGFATAVAEMIVHLAFKHSGKQTPKHDRHDAFGFSSGLNSLTGLLGGTLRWTCLVRSMSGSVSS